MPQSAEAVEVRWVCWYEIIDESAHCLLDHFVLTATAGEGEDPETVRLAVELPPNLPGVARDLRLRPADFIGVEMVVPFFAPPSEPSRVQELAQEVMCGMRQQCTAVIVPGRMSAQLLNRLEDDPALN